MRNYNSSANKSNPLIQNPLLFGTHNPLHVTILTHWWLGGLPTLPATGNFILMFTPEACEFTQRLKQGNIEREETCCTRLQTFYSKPNQNTNRWWKKLKKRSVTRVLPTIDHGIVINNIAHQKCVEIHIWSTLWLATSSYTINMYRYSLIWGPSAFHC